MIQKIRNKIIKDLGGYTAEDYLDLHIRAENMRIEKMRAEAYLEHERAINRGRVVRLRAETSYHTIQCLDGYVPEMQLRHGLIQKLAEAMLPHCVMRTREDKEKGLVFYSAGVSVVMGGDDMHEQTD